jgi:hypothetical protein
VTVEGGHVFATIGERRLGLDLRRAVWAFVLVNRPRLG